MDLEKTGQLDKLARGAGELYSRILVSYWRVIRKKSIFLSNYTMQKWHTSPDLHAHSSDAIADNFYVSIKSANERKKKGDSEAKYPRRRKYFYKITWKVSGIRLKDKKLILSNGKGNEPVIIPWQWDKPKQVEIGWKQSGGYQLRAVYTIESHTQPKGNLIAAVDLGELRSATTHDGEETVIYNGRLIKSKVAYRNKITARFQELITKTKRGSNRCKRLVRAKKRQLAKINHQINDILLTKFSPEGNPPTKLCAAQTDQAYCFHPTRERGANAGHWRYSGYTFVDRLRQGNEPKAAWLVIWEVSGIAYLQS